MQKRVNPTLIGLFIIGALALAVIGVGVLAPVMWFGDRATFVSYFDESVHGLEGGAPVKFQGVPVGTVREIDVRIDTDDMGTDVPVRFDINLQRLRAHTADFVDLGDPQTLQDHIEAGLRAQLQMESFVTGLLFVNLAYFENPAPPRTILAEYSVIPSRPSALAALETEGGDLMASVHSMLNQTNEFLEGLDGQEITTSLVGAAHAVERLADAPEIRQAFGEVPGVSEQLQQTLSELDLLIAEVGGAVDPFAARMDETGAEAVLTLQTMREAIEDTRGALNADSGVGYQVDEALVSLTRAAEALRQLAQSLERDPSMLIRGRSPEQ